MIPGEAVEEAKRFPLLGLDCWPAADERERLRDPPEMERHLLRKGDRLTFKKFQGAVYGIA